MSEDGTQGHKYGVIHCPSIIQTSTNYLLHNPDSFLVNFGGIVWWDGVLCPQSIFSWWRFVGAVLRFGGLSVIESMP